MLSKVHLISHSRMSGPIPSWKIDVETVVDFIFLGSKIIVDGDCSHEIKTLTPWNKSDDHPRQNIKRQRHYFANKGPSSQGYDFPIFSFSSVQFSCSAVPDSLWSHELQHARLPCHSPTPGVYPNSCPLIRWCHPTISSSVIPFSSCPQSFPAPGSFQMSQLFAPGSQTIGVSASASVLPKNTQDRSSLGWTGWISLQSKGPSRVFSNTTVEKHQFFGA